MDLFNIFIGQYSFLEIKLNPRRWLMKRIAFILLVFLQICFLSVTGIEQVCAQTGPSKLIQEFNKPNRTIEYHYLLVSEGITEATLKDFIKKTIAPHLKDMFEVGDVSKPKWGIYIDSPDRVLDKSYLILRVRSGQITVKSRGKSPDALIDLYDTGKKKYEIDYFGSPEYSISVDVRFTKEQFNVDKGFTTEELLNFMEKASPPLMDQLRPYLTNRSALVIPGKAIMYDIDIKILPTHQMASKLKEVGLTAWFFPPTSKSLMELSFVAEVQDKKAVDGFYNELKDHLRKVDLLHPIQKSKTELFFEAYFGK
jgi:hypothetical protein